MEIELKKDDNKGSEIKPTSLKEEDWEDWGQAFVTYLSNIWGKQKALLDFVIRPIVDPSHVFQTAREQELYSFPLTGAFFREDNKHVYRLLSDLVKDQPATWIQPLQSSQNGCASWLALAQHYDGRAQKDKRVAKAEATIPTLYCNNERVFSFDASCATKLVRAFCTLEGATCEVPPANQVKTFLTNMKNTQNPAVFVVMKCHVRSTFRLDLMGAIEYLSEEITVLYLSGFDTPASRCNTRHRYFSIVRTGLNGDNNWSQHFKGTRASQWGLNVLWSGRY